MQITKTPPSSQEFALTEQLESVLGSLPWAALAVDARGYVVYANEQLETLGWPAPQEIRGQHLQTVLPAYLHALQGDPAWLTPQQAEITRPGRHGERHERIWVRPVPGGAYLIVMDETAARESERNSAQTARLASIGFMLSGVCHEVSNPLAATYSMVQILRSQDEVSQEVMREGLDRIAANVKRILDVSRRINEFCRVGKPSPVRVDDAVEEALALLREDRSCHGVTVTHVANPHAVVSGDPAHLRQVFYNLVLNACQALRGGGEVVIRSEPGSDGRIHAYVEDTGPGIAPDHLDRLFEPFFTTKPSGEGTGLGLSITRDLVQEHGGAISASNRPEGGARFALAFPEGLFSHE